MGSGGDALVGLKVQPLPGVGAKKVNYQKKLRIFEEQIRREIVHRVSSKQRDVQTTVYIQRDAGISVGGASPMNGAVVIPQGESEPGVALEVETVDGDFARIGYGGGKRDDGG